MVHKVLEEWIDTLLYVGIVIGLMGFFSYTGGMNTPFVMQKLFYMSF